MNDLLLRLDVNNESHKAFANTLLDSFFQYMENDALFEYMYTSTVEHRLKVIIMKVKKKKGQYTHLYNLKQNMHTFS